MSHLWPTVLGTLLRSEDLPAALAVQVMDEIVSDAATPAQIAAFAVLLRAKGETADEIAGLVASLTRHAIPVPLDGVAVDVVGTGGDGAHTVNVLTMAALVVAGTGRRVVKHGARSASSSCGAADVLEELGVRIDLQAEPRSCGQSRPPGSASCSRRSSSRACATLPCRAVRLVSPTVFNLLGPLINPARPPASLIGCADPAKAPLLAQVFAGRGGTALVVRGDDGLDELTTTTTSTMWIAAGSRVDRVRIDPAALGVPTAAEGVLGGGDRVHNAEVVRAVLAGRPGPVRDAVLLNAAAAIVAYDAAHDSPSPDAVLAAFPTALGLAADAIDSGAAARTLDAWVGASTTGR